MVTPLHALKDLALQPRKSSHFHLTRISTFRDQNFSVKNFKRYSTLLTEHLVRDFRITKTVNKDATTGVVRELKTADFADNEGELGLCCVVDSRVAPDHAKIDGTLGPRTSFCDVVLCIGKSDGDGFRFAFALTRGRKAVIESTLGFLRKTFGAETTPATVAPHHLMFLAREWTRDLDEENQGESMREEGRKFERLTRLEMVFALPASVQTTSGGTRSVTSGELESIHVMIEREQLRALHGLVEKGEANSVEARMKKDPALVTAIANHISKYLHVDLTGAGVTEIVTPTAELTNQGLVRFLWPSHLKRAMVHLQEVSKSRSEQLEL